MNFIRFCVLLLHAVTVLSTKCTTNNGERGTCNAEDDCPANKPRPLTSCGSNGLFCCPSGDHREPSPRLPDPKYPESCGSTPGYGIRQISGGYTIEPDEYSWLASLQYGNRTRYGSCAGSVINSLYLLTAAHCVKSKRIQEIGGV